MYTNHFGLERRIFRGNTAGADVFVGPQMAGFQQGIKKALTAPDAVATLTGPVGCGKSTAVAHSLGAINGKNAIVRVGRFPLRRGELLDLLFDHMRIQQRPQRSNQKLALFRALLFNLAKNDSRMFILVEDAPFLGTDMLAELEVVTAADTGPSDGAAIVMMGDDYLKELLASKSLARLRQRIRLRRNLKPCGAEELDEYLRHCFLRAGGDFDRVFDDGAIDLLCDLSGGILRVVNNLVESALEAAAETKAANVSLDLISRVADEEFGLTGKFTRLPEISSKQPEPQHSDDTTTKLVALSLPAGQALAGSDDDDLPELIEDTQPDLAILSDAPTATKAAEQESGRDTPQASETASPGPEPGPMQDPKSGAIRPPETEPKPRVQPRVGMRPGTDVEPGLEAPLEGELETEPVAGHEPQPADDDTIPTLTEAIGTIAAPAKDSPADDDTPDWERDPTLAELRPDLDALERAMAVAHGRDPDAAEESAAFQERERKEPSRDETEDIPEITLDDSINRKVDIAALKRKIRLEKEGLVEEDDADTDKAEASVEEGARQDGSAAELEKIAQGLARAKNIEDVDDQLAETLFGEEFSVAAAAVAARVADDTAVEAAGASEKPAAAAPPPKSELEKGFETVWGETPSVEVSIDSEIEDQNGGMDMAASLRLATVRALNSDYTDTAAAEAPDAPVAQRVKPDPIEEQITTSLTQTMNALKFDPDPAAINDDDDDDDDEREGGFFSRFRRS